MISPKKKDYLPYKVGPRIYGGGRSFPTMGPVDKLGYRERDLKHKARRQAMLNRLKAKQKGHYLDPDVGRKI